MLNIKHPKYLFEYYIPTYPTKEENIYTGMCLSNNVLKEVYNTQTIIDKENLDFIVTYNLSFNLPSVKYKIRAIDIYGNKPNKNICAWDKIQAELEWYKSVENQNVYYNLTKQPFYPVVFGLFVCNDYIMINKVSGLDSVHIFNNLRIKFMFDYKIIFEGYRLTNPEMFNKLTNEFIQNCRLDIKIRQEIKSDCMESFENWLENTLKFWSESKEETSIINNLLIEDKNCILTINFIKNKFETTTFKDDI